MAWSDADGRGLSYLPAGVVPLDRDEIEKCPWADDLDPSEHSELLQLPVPGNQMSCLATDRGSEDQVVLMVSRHARNRNGERRHDGLARNHRKTGRAFLHGEVSLEIGILQRCPEFPENGGGNDQIERTLAPPPHQVADQAIGTNNARREHIRVKDNADHAERGAGSCR